MLARALCSAGAVDDNQKEEEDEEEATELSSSSWLIESVNVCDDRWLRRSSMSDICDRRSLVIQLLSALRSCSKSIRSILGIEHVQIVLLLLLMIDGLSKSVGTCSAICDNQSLMTRESAFVAPRASPSVRNSSRRSLTRAQLVALGRTLVEHCTTTLLGGLMIAVVIVC